MYVIIRNAIDNALMAWPLAPFVTLVLVLVFVVLALDTLAPGGGAD